MPTNNSSKMRQAINDYNRKTAEHNRKVVQAINDYNRKVAETNKRNIDNYNREVARVNTANRRAVDKHNRAVSAYNATTRAHQQRRLNEIARFNMRPTSSVQHVTYRTSVETLQRSFTHIEDSANQGEWTGDAELFDMAEGEAANSVAVLNAFEESSDDVTGESQVQPTVITTELRDISPDLDDRWQGALYALNPRNRDAARQFCTSAREILVKILDLKAPDKIVLATWPNAQLTQQKQVQRREKIRFCLFQSGYEDAQLANFVDADINNVMDLFPELNPATHGEAGLYNFGQLKAIKRRVEGAIQFLHRIVMRIER